MKLIKELTDPEVIAIAEEGAALDCVLNEDIIKFARALFEAAWIKQQVEK